MFHQKHEAEFFSLIEISPTIKSTTPQLSSFYPISYCPSKLIAKLNPAKEKVILYSEKPDLTLELALYEKDKKSQAYAIRTVNTHFSTFPPKTYTVFYQKHEPRFFDLREISTEMFPTFSLLENTPPPKSFHRINPKLEKKLNSLFSFAPSLVLEEVDYTIGILSAEDFDPSSLYLRKINEKTQPQIPPKSFYIIALLEEDISFLQKVISKTPYHPLHDTIHLTSPSYRSTKALSFSDIFTRNTEILPFAIASPKICHQAILQPENIQLPSISNVFGREALSNFQSISKETIFPNQTILETAFYIESVNTNSYEISYSPYVLVQCSYVPKEFKAEEIANHTASNEINELLFPKLKKSDRFIFTEIPTGSLFVGKSELSNREGLEKKAASVNRSLRLTHLNILSLPTLEELACDSLGDDFAIRVKVLPNLAQDGYIFTAQIKPYDRDGLYSINQHVYFILDCSRQIEAHRFETFKKGILQAIHYLDPNTKFHILALGSNIQRLNSDGLLPTKGSELLAQKFLSRVEQSSKVRVENFTQIINQIQEKSKSKDEIHAAYLLSNGRFMKNIRMHRTSLESMIHNNQNSFALHTATISDENNLPMMKWLAKINHGEFLHCSTHASFPRKFALLIKQLRRPLAYDIHISAFLEANQINFLHNPHFSPYLYCDKGYTFYGTARELKDTPIILQGRAGDKWINISTTLPLEGASRSRITLEKNFAQQKALVDVIKFIDENKEDSLSKAQETLAPYNITVR